MAARVAPAALAALAVLGAALAGCGQPDRGAPDPPVPLPEAEAWAWTKRATEAGPDAGRRWWSGESGGFALVLSFGGADAGFLEAAHVPPGTRMAFNVSHAEHAATLRLDGADLGAAGEADLVERGPHHIEVVAVSGGTVVAAAPNVTVRVPEEGLVPALSAFRIATGRSEYGVGERIYVESRLVNLSGAAWVPPVYHGRVAASVQILADGAVAATYALVPQESRFLDSLGITRTDPPGQNYVAFASPGPRTLSAVVRDEHGREVASSNTVTVQVR